MYPCFPKVGKCFFEITNMIRLFLCFDDNIVDVCFDIPSKLSPKRLLHQASEGCPRIFETKGHSDIEKCSSVCYEACMHFILLHHLHVMIAGIGIQEA